MKLSVIIPARNEEKNLSSTLSEIKQLISGIMFINDFEIIVVDDHSSDDTFKLIRGMNEGCISAIRLSKQSGSHNALRAGLSICRGDAALCISADGQDDPMILPEMLDLLNKNYEVVWAHRKHDGKFSSLNIFRLFFYFILKICTKHSSVDPATADYFLIGRKMINSINSCDERNTSLFGLITWLGFNQTSVYYERKDRRNGHSKWNFSSRLKLASDWIISFSGIPLKIITSLGFTTALIGLLYAIYIIILGIMELTTPGWAETIIIVLVLGGIQMIMLGITGEYIWRNLEESRKRPFFIVEDSININR